MKKTSFIILVIAASFLSGFAVKTVITKQTQKPTNMKKVTGIGGIFFKCKDPNKMKEWYKTHLGIDAGQYGASFEWFEDAEGKKKGLTQWNLNSETAKLYEPSTKDFMINYRVENLEALAEELKKEGVTILDTIATYDYGKFLHILDTEGNKIQLWEPKD
jgi:predicted enzyme related to lactoylglutathione lyase